MAKEGGIIQGRAGTTNTASDQSSCPDEMTLASFLDGRLGKAELAEMELHLGHCEKCRKAVDELRDILSQMDPLSEDPAVIKNVADRAKKLIGK